MKNVKDILQVYYIAGSQNVKGMDLTASVQAAIDGGITCFQFREKGDGALTGDKREALALKVQQICKEHDVPFFVNDDVELAVRLKADGIHVGQEDMTAKDVKNRIPSDCLLGVSVHSLGEARQAMLDGADYLGIGPVYPTGSKADAQAVIGPEGIRAYREAGIRVPIVAIGGVTEDNTPEVIEAGADGVSMISAIAASEDPKETVARFKQVVHSHRT